MKYRKKPVVIDAVQFVVTKRIPCKFGDALEYNDGEVARFMGWPAIRIFTAPSDVPEGRSYIEIPTMEGVMQVNVGDWIIRGVKGEFYPCRSDIFAATYEPAE